MQESEKKKRQRIQKLKRRTQSQGQKDGDRQTGRETVRRRRQGDTAAGGAGGAEGPGLHEVSAVCSPIRPILGPQLQGLVPQL